MKPSHLFEDGNPFPIDTIFHGDCIHHIEKLPENSVDVVFADPPYNLQLSRALYRPNLSRVDPVNEDWDKFTNFHEYDDFTRKWISACRRILKTTGTLWVIGSYHNIFRIGTILQDMDFWILNDIAWIKDNPMPNFRGVRFTNAHETLIWAQKEKGSKYTFNHHALKSLNDDLQMRSDWYFPLCTGRERIRKNGKKAHATQKPEALLYRIITASTNPGDIILDPFLGTGTTCAVAKKMGRHFLGIEQDLEYFKVARNRINSVSPSPSDTLQSLEKRRQPRIPFGTLLESGEVHPGQSLIFAKNHAIRATIQADGRIYSGNTCGSIHFVAKSLLDGAPANGWDLWLVKEGDQLIPINALRQKFIQKNRENY